MDWWSLRPLRRPAVPVCSDPSRRNPIDAFIIAKLREHGLRLSPEADRRTLIRRLYFDLVGLPPAPEEVAAFVGDADPLAYEKLVERLLASPHYGEGWARHWLDVVHYGDTHGYDKDQPRPNAWPYRDYVIRAFNQDKPYGRFIQEQIAGDRLSPDTEDGVTALGFIAAGPWDLIGHSEVPESKIDGKIARSLDRDDMVANTLNTFCSLTVQCARCHNHKFDPVTQEDYYRLQAVIAALDRADKPYDTDRGLAQKRRNLAGRQRALTETKQRLEAQIRQAGGRELELLDQQIAGANKATQPGATPETGQHSAPGSGPTSADLQRQREDLLQRTCNCATQCELDSTTQELEAMKADLAKLPPPKLVYAGMVHYGSGAFCGTGPSGGRPRPIHLLARGDVQRPGREVGPGTLPFIPGFPAVFDLPADAPEGARRVALAQWLSDARNPLTWRSIVNRVWQYHFGRGIADTPNDFGRMGQPPAHPELLDWLAVEFRDGGQSLKQLHHLIVTSATYRQSSQARLGPGDPGAIDADNRLLWRMNRRKLEAEAVRDAVLAVAGQLDLTLGGPSYRDFVIEKPEHSPHYEYSLHDPEDPKTHRRSIYRFIVRSQPQPFMSALDCADPSMSVDRRNETLNALQALALLNDRFMVVMANHFAARVERLAQSPEQQVSAALGLALGRPPDTAEVRLLASHVRQYGLASACRFLFNLNEFVFID